MPKTRMQRADGSLHAQLSAVQRRRIARDDRRDAELFADLLRATNAGYEMRALVAAELPE